MGHETAFAGHLGVKKTFDRIVSNFYWPGIFSRVRRFCASCDICQRTVKKSSVSKAPLHSVPVVGNPFEKVAIDLIGPIFPVSSRGNRWILTLIDYATRYPEAIALKSTDTETVAEALLDIFSRVGVPNSIVSDNGPQFVSNIMKEVSRLLSIETIHSSPYHPQGNGLVERLNGTLKSMLRRMCAEKPKDWDRFLQPLMFAYREAPQHSLLFSPFEMLYGRTVRGPMSILRELWSEKEIPQEMKNVYSYVLDLRNRLEETCILAKENLANAQAISKSHFDKKSKLRILKPNDLALVMLPTDENKLLMRWKGPFKVIEPIGINDYRIEIGDNVKIFHINMLRKYTERNPDDIAASFSILETNAEEDNTDIDFMPNTSSDDSSWRDVIIGSILSTSQTQELTSLLSQYSEIFSDIPGCTDLVTHSIELSDDTPIRLKPYPIPFSKGETFDEEVRKMFDLGIIELSSSPYRSPMLLVKKSDGSYRPVIDFRAINKITKFFAEPVPNPEVIFAKLSKARYLSKLDFTKGFWQIPMSTSDKEKTAFATSMGLVHFRFMPFGLVNAGATFSRLMRILLDKLQNVDNYIDDVLVHSQSWEEHLCSLRSVFQRIQKAGLTIKPSKCQIGHSSVSFVGHQIMQGKLQTRQQLIEKIATAKLPVTVKNVRSFLGLTGYYRKFVPHYADVAAPLVQLTRKGQPQVIVWSEESKVAFEKLKSLLCSAPVLRLPDLQRPFVLRTDASNTALGAVLLQEYNEMLFPVAYASKALSNAQQAYSVIERECLSIVWSLDKYYPYLYGTKFIIQTDHKPLAYLQSAKLTNPRLMRWALKIQPFYFHIETITGSNNIGADFLSRC